MKTVTIVVPVYNEEENIVPFYEAVSREVFGLDYEFEILYVNDGSTDKTASIVLQLYQNQQDVFVSLLSYYPNRGKEAAIYEGLKEASSDYIILMDGDLEHPPSLIPKMLEILEHADYSAVGAKRKTRWISNVFTFFFNLLTPVHLEYGATDFMCMTPSFVEKVLQTEVKYRFTKGLFASTGLPVCWLVYLQPPRAHGQGKWNFWKLFRYGIQSIIAFSNKQFKKQESH